MDDYWRLGKWIGIPVFMHWTVLLSFAWMYLLFGDIPSTIIGSVALFVLFVAHEFGHVVALRRSKVYIDRITFYGIHGETTHADPRKSIDEILIAWGGVLAQFMVLLLAFATSQFLIPSGNAFVWMYAGTILFVFTKLNLFLIVIALLPIGPFDGRVAWRVIPLFKLHLRNKTKKEKVKEIKLTPEQRRELEKSSEKIASEFIDRLGKK